MAGAGVARADEASLYRGPGPRPGPDILYAGPAAAPQLTNAGVWRADPILVSGARAYRGGEFVYQDFLYDDHGARAARDPGDPRTGDDTFSGANGTYTYPSDPVYADNAADLVELRVKPLADATAFRLTLNSMNDAEKVAATIAIGSSAAPLPFPHGANATAPAAMFLTVHGSSADLLDAVTQQPVAGGAPTASVDRERRQIEVRVPHAAWDPGAGPCASPRASGSGTPPPAPTSRRRPRRARRPRPAAAGRARRRSSTWRSASTSRCRRWATRPARRRTRPGGATSARAATCRPATSPRSTPTWTSASSPTGPTTRAACRAPACSTGSSPAASSPSRASTSTRSAAAPSGCEGELLGRLQPYALYVPEKAPAGGRYGLQLLLHSLGANYNQFSGSRNQAQFGDRGRGHIVMTPAGRGPDGWYYDRAGADTFEVWADVARHYALDPDVHVDRRLLDGRLRHLQVRDPVPGPVREGPADGRAARPRRLGAAEPAAARRRPLADLPPARVAAAHPVPDLERERRPARPAARPAAAGAGLRRPRLPLRVRRLRPRRAPHARDPRPVRAGGAVPRRRGGDARPGARLLRAQPDDGLPRRGHDGRPRLLAVGDRRARGRRRRAAGHARRGLGRDPGGRRARRRDAARRRLAGRRQPGDARVHLAEPSVGRDTLEAAHRRLS